MVDRIGHYRIVAELGRGGMGVVYKAHEESLNRFVALKVLGEHLTEDESHVQRFIREAQSAAALNHPNIVQIYAVSEDDGIHYFAMEYVSGKSLQQILRTSGPLSSIEVAKIALQTASGLQAAHEQGIIHRDIKPANLMVDERGLVKIADFGLALITGGASRLTATGMFMGTPGYLSPEQCLDQNPDHRTDIYSLGVTLFEALSGKIPFSADSPLALLRQIVEVEPPDLSELAPEVDEELRALVARMMAKDRDLRVANCAELIGGLEAYLDSRGAAGNLAVRLVTKGVPGGPPPPPTHAEQLDSQPTMAVSGEQDETGALPKPPPATAPALGATEAPVVATAPLEEPPTGGAGRLALVAVLVVVIGLAAVVGGGIYAWRSGIFTTARNEAPMDDASNQNAADTSPQQAVAGPAEITGDDESVETAGSQPVDARPAGTMGSDNPPKGQQAPPLRDASAKGLDASREDSNIHRSPAEKQGREPVNPPPRMPPPEGTVVIAVGETVFAGEAESFMEDALARAGFTLVDEHSIPGVGGLLAEGAGRAPGELHRALRPYARNAVIIRVEYLGERPLVYMGQRDVAFQARVTVVPVDLQAGGPASSPIKFRVEYTHLNAERVAGEKLRAPARQVAETLDNG